MYFLKYFFSLAIASSLLLSHQAQAMWGTGMYGGMQNCEMGAGSAMLDKEEKDYALGLKAQYKVMQKHVKRLEGELKALGREVGVRGDAEEIVDFVTLNSNKIKRAVGDDFYSVFVSSSTKNIKCALEGEGKRESGYELVCATTKPDCNSFIDAKTDAELQKLALDLGSEMDPSKTYDCSGLSKYSNLPEALVQRCSAGAGITYSTLEALISTYKPIDGDPAVARAICANPTRVCNSTGNRNSSEFKSCNDALAKVNPDLMQKTSEYQQALTHLELLAEDAGPYDYYTEGSFCYECMMTGQRRFVDDRSGIRKFADTMLPILGSAAAVYGGYSLHKEAIDRATNLGFTTNPAPSFLSFGWPMLMNGVYGGIASGIGAGAFMCAGLAGGAFPGGNWGMMGPYGMGAMMGQGGPFGYPFGQSPFGFPGMGGPFMPGMVGGIGAGPWGIGGNLGIGPGFGPIIGMPGSGVMGMAGVPGMMGMAGLAGGGFGAFGVPGGFGAPGMMGMAGVPGGFGAPGMMGSFGGGIVGMAGMAGLPGGFGVPGGFGAPGMMGMAGVPGGFGAPGMMGMAGVPGGFGAPGMMGMAGMMGAFGVPGGFGAPGMMGMAGVPGGFGAPGMMGMAGLYSVPGAMGIAGVPGMAGIAGVPGIAGVAGGAQWMQYQQQMLQQQMQQYQMQLAMLQQYQEAEANKMRIRTQLQQQMYQLQMQLWQLEVGGGYGGVGSVIGVGFGTTYGSYPGMGVPGVPGGPGALPPPPGYNSGGSNSR